MTQPPAEVDPILEQGALGPFEVVRQLGAGGMGVVYLARQPGLDRLVALKVVRPHLAANPDLMARFQREYRTHSQLDHPHIVRFLDAGEADGYHYCTMEYLEARPLDELIRPPHDPARGAAMALRVAAALASALGYLHKKEILHRDIKPGNIMIEEGSGRVILMDFGLVKPRDVTQLTREGKTVGSPRYMAPESLAGERADGQTDIYQVGVTLYQVATGKVPYDGANLSELAAAILYRDLVPPRAACPGLPENLDALIRNALARDRADRYEDARQLADDIVRAQAGLTVRLIAPPEAEEPEEADVPTGPAAGRPRRSSGLGRAVTGSGASVSVAGLSAPHPVVSTQSMSASFSGLASGAEARRGRPKVLPGLLALAGLSFVPFFFYRGATQYSAREVTRVPGDRAVRMRWRGAPAYPSKVLVHDTRAGEGGEPQIFLGGEPGPGGEHEVMLEPLDPAREYQARIAFPDGTLSLPYTLPKAGGDRPELQVSRRYEGDRVVLTMHVSPPAQGALRYRAGERWREVDLGGGVASRHELTLPVPEGRGAYRDVAVTLRTVNGVHTLPVREIPGHQMRRDDLARALRDVDYAAVFERLDQTEAPTRREVLAALAVPDLEPMLASLEADAGLSPARGADWRLLRALQDLETVDIWLENQDRPRVLHVARAFASMVRLARPKTAPPGGIEVARWEIGGVTSWVPFGGIKQSRAILNIYAGSTSIERHEELRFTVEIPRDTPRRGRAAIGLKVRNLHPEVGFRVTVDGNRAVLLTNDAASFPGFYWAQMSGDKDEGDAAVRRGILRHQHWIYAEVPAALLPPGRRHLTLRAEANRGLSPNFMVDAYRLVVWPQAPTFPGEKPKKGH